MRCRNTGERLELGDLRSDQRVAGCDIGGRAPIHRHLRSHRCATLTHVGHRDQHVAIVDAELEDPFGQLDVLVNVASDFWNSGITYLPKSSMDFITFSCGTVSVAMRKWTWSIPASS